MLTRFSPLIGCLLLALLTGYLAGRLTSVRIADASIGYAWAEDTRSAAATVRLDRIEAGELVGTAVGDARLVLGGRPVQVQSGAFRVPAGVLLTEVIPVVIPPGMRFVASKKGSRYYPIDAAGGQNIVPQNRIYFPSAMEAEAAGYRK